MDEQSENRQRPRWYLALEVVFLLWAVVLLFVGLRYLYLNPIVPASGATVAGNPSAADTVVPSNTPTPAPTASNTITIAPTWTASPTATRRPSTGTPPATETPAPTPTASYTPTPLPTAHWADSPTLIIETITPDATAVTAIPTPVPTMEIPSGTINILLLGSDHRPEALSWLTDVIIVVSINPEGPSAAMLSIPRDMYVWVPDWRMAKINTVDAHGSVGGDPDGGPNLLKQTLLYNFGIPVQYYARVDFEGFKRIVDTLGGIDIPITCEMTDWRLKSPELDQELEENWALFTVEPKIQHMDGDMALWYVRSRKRSSDFDRSRRQQQALRAMMAKGLAIDVLPQVPQLWSDFSDTVETDLGLGEILQLAALAPRLEFSKIKSRFVSGDAVLSWTTPDNNQYVLLPQYEEIAKLVEDVFEPPSENRAFQDPPVVEVWNGTLREDLDLLAVDNLQWEGLIPVLGQADRQDYSQTQVIFYGQTFKGANTWSITKLFGIYEAQMIHQPDPNSPVDYRVILGYDFEPCVHKVFGARSAPTVTPTPEWTPPPG